MPIERLPIELLERIFLLTSAQDILRLSLVRSQGLLRPARLLNVGISTGQWRFPWPHTNLSLNPVQDRPRWCRIAA